MSASLCLSSTRSTATISAGRRGIVPSLARLDIGAEKRSATGTDGDQKRQATALDQSPGLTFPELPAEVWRVVFDRARNALQSARETFMRGDPDSLQAFIDLAFGAAQTVNHTCTVVNLVISHTSAAGHAENDRVCEPAEWWRLCEAAGFAFWRVDGVDWRVRFVQSVVLLQDPPELDTAAGTAPVIVMAALAKGKCELGDLGDDWTGNKAAVLVAVMHNGTALRFAKAKLNEDRDVVLAAVNSEGYALRHASPGLKKDKEVVLAAVNSDGLALQYAQGDLSADKDLVLAAVIENGEALQYASDDLKNDRQVVLAAVNSFGRALQYAQGDLSADKEVVLAAVGQDRLALQYASDELKNDRQVVLATMRRSDNFSV